MKKELNKNEMIEEIELTKEVKTEELTEETLETVDGGCDPFTLALLGFGIAQFAGVAKKILC